MELRKKEKYAIIVLMFVFIIKASGFAGAQDLIVNCNDDESNSETFFEDGKTASRIRIALNGGWSYRTAKINKKVPEHLVSHMKELRNGYNMGISAAYYFSEKIGTGILFNYFNSKNETYFKIPTMTEITNMSVRDNISIYFIGQTFGTRLLNRNKQNGFVLNFGLGYLGFYDKGQLHTQKIILKNGTLGATWDVGYDIGLSDNFALGIRAAYIAGFLTSYKSSNGIITQRVKLEKEDYENLSTINISVGLRFNLGKTQVSISRQE